MYSKLRRGQIALSTAIVLPLGTAIWALYEIVIGNEKFYSDIMMPIVHKLTDGENAHNLAIKALKWGLYPRNKQEYSILKTTIAGLAVTNPIGIAAGFDKDGQVIDEMANLGCGLVEIGSVTPLPQTGNPKPRVFRLLEDHAIINRYGFNSAGMGKVMTNLEKSQLSKSPPNSEFRPIIGVNLGKNKDTPLEEAHLNYETGMVNFGGLCDYVVINVSSPNTPGLRNLQTTQHLKTIINQVSSARSRVTLDNINRSTLPRIFLKISPDISAEDRISVVRACEQTRAVDALIVSNTTTKRPATLNDHAMAQESGGLSGRPLKQLSTEAIHDFYRLSKGRIPIIGCGGIENGRDAYEKIRAGASAVQVYTAMVFQGFPIISKLKRELSECLEKDGFKSINEAIGADHK